MSTPLAMTTTKRDGYDNDATWIVCLHLENDRNAQYHFKNVLPHMKLMTLEKVEYDVQSWLTAWFTNDAAGYTDVAQKIIENWLGNFPDWLDWPQIVSFLHRPSQTIMDVHLYTMDTVLLLRKWEWYKTIEGVESYSQQAEILISVLRGILQPYQSNPGPWQQKELVETKVVERIYQEYLSAVNWQQVYDDLIRE